MRAMILIGALALLLPALTTAQSDVENRDHGDIRLNAFYSVQRVCLTTLLRNRELAANTVGATRTPATHLCECAALLSVSNAADSDLALMPSSDAARKSMLDRFAENFPRCVKIQPD